MSIRLSAILRNVLIISLFALIAIDIVNSNSDKNGATIHAQNRSKNVNSNVKQQNKHVIEKHANEETNKNHRITNKNAQKSVSVGNKGKTVVTNKNIGKNGNKNDAERGLKLESGIVGVHSNKNGAKVAEKVNGKNNVKRVETKKTASKNEQKNEQKNNPTNNNKKKNGITGNNKVIKGRGNNNGNKIESNFGRSRTTKSWHLRNNTGFLGFSTTTPITASYYQTSANTSSTSNNGINVATNTPYYDTSIPITTTTTAMIPITTSTPPIASISLNTTAITNN